MSLSVCLSGVTPEAVRIIYSCNNINPFHLLLSVLSLLKQGAGYSQYFDAESGNM